MKSGYHHTLQKTMSPNPSLDLDLASGELRVRVFEVQNPNQMQLPSVFQIRPIAHTHISYQAVFESETIANAQARYIKGIHDPKTAHRS